MVSGPENGQVGGPENGQVGGLENGQVGRAERRLPPVTALAVAALTLVLAGGIDLAAHLPRPAPLALPVAALAASAGALLAAAAVLARVRDFAWHTFFVVGGWTLAAYVVIAGMLEFVFILDHTPASLLAVFSLMLAVFAIDIPLLLAFSVARYQPAGAAGAGRDVVAPSP
jgi:hypothetical protein